MRRLLLGLTANSEADEETEEQGEKNDILNKGGKISASSESKHERILSTGGKKSSGRKQPTRVQESTEDNSRI